MKNKIEHYGVEEAPFSDATQSGSLLFVSGQGSFDRSSGKVVRSDIESETVLTVQNLETILSQSNLSLKDVVKVNVYLSDRKHYEKFNHIYSRLFPQPYPARTLVYCDLNFDILVEIDVIAKLRHSGCICSD